MKQSTQHLAFETLVQLAEGARADRGLAASARNEAEMHLAGCASCRTLYGEAQRIVAALHGDDLAAAPPYAIARALQAFRPLARPVAAGAEGPGLVRRWLEGLLQFDSAAAPAYGLRSGGEAQPARQVVYTLDAYDLDLRLEPDGAGWLVAGQLLGSDAPGMATLAGEEGRHDCALNDLGEFTFEDLRPGVYKLSISLPDVDLVISTLSVGG